jgi:hypothetical protein
MVAAVSVGSAVITVTTQDGGKTAACTVTVYSAGNNVLTGTISINGNAEAGQTLTANTAGLGGNGIISYEWKRNGTAIGANSSAYTVQAADIGFTITVTVTRAGNSGDVTSTPTAVVLPVFTISSTADWNASVSIIKHIFLRPNR